MNVYSDTTQCFLKILNDLVPTDTKAKADAACLVPYKDLENTATAVEIQDSFDDSGTKTSEVGIQCNLSVRATRSIKVQTDISFNSEVSVASIDTQTDFDLKAQQEIPRYVSFGHCYNKPLSPSPIQPSSNQSDEVSPSKSTSSATIDTDCDEDITVDMYLPDTSDQSDTETEEEELESKLVSEKKVLVFEQQLDKLFVICSCGKPIIESSKTFVGTMAVVKSVCLDGHHNKWQSQPTLQGKIPGNIMIAASILFSGNSFASVNSLAKRLNLAFISSSLFYEIQKNILFPVIERVWKGHQDDLLNEIKQSKKLEVCGDGRCDSPGHCAKYGTYTILDESTSKIIDFSVVQVTEVTSSNAMEAEGCNRVLQNMKDRSVNIKCLTTDRHVTVTSEMRKKHPKIKHQYDVWHLAKWVVKKLTKKANKKDCADLMHWIQSISSHFWWSVSTCDGDYEMLIEKWTSIVNHISNKHSWRKGKLFKKCVHHKLTRSEVKEKVWLKPGTAAAVALEEVVYNNKLLKDMQLVTEFHHTGDLEVYHSMMLKYCPKRQHFSYQGMVARTQLAALDNNHNCKREQATIQQGENKGNLRYNLVFPKGRKTWVVKPIKESKTYGYLDCMMKSVLEDVDGVNNSGPVAANIATTPKPDKRSAILSHRSRFQKK